MASRILGELATSPLPLVLIQRGAASDRALGTLPTDARIELIRANERTTDWVSTAQRSAAVLVATNADPLSALLYVITAGINAPILVAASRRFAQQKSQVVRAGASACFLTPLTRADVNTIVQLLAARSTGVTVDGSTRLVLDPIGRSVRLHAKSVRLSEREFALLYCLSNRSGRPVSAVELLAFVWAHMPPRARTRTVLEVYIFSLRKKLKQLGLARAIRTVRGFGYALTTPD